MRILVTGGAGLLGRQFTRALGEAGAGVVADSDPAAEYQECVNKAAAVLAAVEAAQHV